MGRSVTGPSDAFNGLSVGNLVLLVSGAPNKLPIFTVGNWVAFMALNPPVAKVLDHIRTARRSKRTFHFFLTGLYSVFAIDPCSIATPRAANCYIWTFRQTNWVETRNDVVQFDAEHLGHPHVTPMK